MARADINSCKIYFTAGQFTPFRICSEIRHATDHAFAIDKWRFAFDPWGREEEGAHLTTLQTRTERETVVFALYETKLKMSHTHTIHFIIAR